MQVFTWKADYGASKAVALIVKVIKFDGYEQSFSTVLGPGGSLSKAHKL